MNEPKTIEVGHTKENFKDRVSDLLEDMWEKIGRYHHGVSGHVSKDYIAPDADLAEAGDVLTYSLDLPGMDEGDVEVTIDDGRLVVRGGRRDEREESGKNYVFRERSYGRFERSFFLPEGVESGKVKANFDKGVLTVDVPYSNKGSGGTHKIEVRRG